MTIDATESILRENKKLIYLYSMVISYNKNILPILDMFTEDHIGADISCGLILFREYCKKSKVWPPSKRVITDKGVAIVKEIIENLIGRYVKNCL